MKLRNIKILELDKNKKGDLFSRLMGDLFYALGYEEPRYDVHKSGREVDITCSHRTEHKIAIAECKAHRATIGGDDINKFVGVLDAERRKLSDDKNQKEVIGYFVSLSGFKETAIQQEEDSNNQRVILVKPKKIVEELVAGKIIVSVEKAVACISLKLQNLNLAEVFDLFAYEKGWVWVLYYISNQKISHYTFVHAEGRPLVKDLADELIALDSATNKVFEKLTYADSLFNENIYLQNDVNVVKDKYFKYLETECGEIQFEGLPTDKDSGSVKVKLENIFVPLYLHKNYTVGRHDTYIPVPEVDRIGVGPAIANEKKIAVLAKPGGGKSTLIKRLAIAYAYPERRVIVDDLLPDIDLFPVFIRCRELGDQINNSIIDIIGNIPIRAEIPSLKESFVTLISDSLQKGNALILIDGLDEISDERSRILFVNQLRVFLSTYPNLYVIMTSREAGYRNISGVLAGYCSQYNLANLNEIEITDLVIKWHKVIIDDSVSTLAEANSLATLINKDFKLQVLAENPLLLTTLLFVKRWVGYLPTKRSVLYQEMIKLLLVTWNVEGYEQLDIDEAEPQLAYVAFWMTQQGKQSITADELKSCLLAARKQMPDILNYTKISVPNFIKRVESRSSLLIMSGHQQIDTGIVPVYEFLHLSFQEYLSAKAIVEKYLPESEIDKSDLSILEPNLVKQNWREIIPLVAVLMKRKSTSLIEYLTEKSKDVAFEKIEERRKRNVKRTNARISKLLGSCIANEIQISPDVLNRAIEWYVKSIDDDDDAETINIIINSKFGSAFHNKIMECFFSEFEGKFDIELASVLSKSGFAFYRKATTIEMFNSIKESILKTSFQEKCIATLALMQLSYESTRSEIEQEIEVDVTLIIEEFIKIFEVDDSYLSFAVSWALVWMASTNMIDLDEDSSSKFAIAVIRKWLQSQNRNTSRFAAWMLIEYMNFKIQIDLILEDIKVIKDLVYNMYNNPKNEYDKIAAVLVGTNLGIAWPKLEIEPVLNSYRPNSDNSNKSLEMYADLFNIKLKLSNVEYKNGTSVIYTLE